MKNLAKNLQAEPSPLQSLLLVSVCLLGSGCGASNDPTKEPATQHLVAATIALQSGDTAAAKESLTKSIEAEPSAWAYAKRAKLLLEEGDAEAALADCRAGLELSPDNADLKWIQGEAKKPPKKRFKGRFAKPPSESK